MITTQEELDTAVAADPDGWHQVGDTNGKWIYAFAGSQVIADFGSQIYARAGSSVTALQGALVDADLGAKIIAHDGSWVDAAAGAHITRVKS